MTSTLDRRKVVTFGIIGAVGCLAGWAIGEVFLAAALPASTPSLAAKPEAAPLPPTTQPTPPPPPAPEMAQVVPPPPPAEFKKLLDAAGAQTGDIQISLRWYNFNDLDLHCVDPSGEEIYFSHKRARSNGTLDVDQNAGGGLTRQPVENIFWPKERAPEGRYRVFVNHYSLRESDPTKYEVSVLVDDKRQEFNGSISSGERKRLIYEFTVGGSLRMAIPEKVVLLPGTSNQMRVRVAARRYTGPVRLRCEGNLNGLKIPEVELTVGQNEATVRLEAESTIDPGGRELRLVAQGGAITAQEQFQVQIEPIPPVLRISAPAEIHVNQGGINVVPVRIARERFHGPVEVRLKDDSEGISLALLEMSDGQDQGEMQLRSDERASDGRRALYLKAVSGPFQAVTELAVVVIPNQAKFAWSTLLTIGVWTGLLATGLSLALAAGQSWYLSKRLPRWQQVLVLVGGGMLAGVLAGGIGQGLFGLLAQANVLPQLGFLIGWAILGGLVGRGIGFFIPNLHGGKAAAAGALGGLLGAAAFMSVSAVGDFAGRCIGAMILGFCIGLVVALIEAAFRDAWLEVHYGTREMRTVNLGPEPIRIGANSSCTIWTRTDQPVALKFWLKNGRVTREDVPANRTHEIGAGHRERVGTLEIVVRTGKAATNATPRTPVAPPPPVRKSAPAAIPRLTSAPATSPVADISPGPKRPPPPPPRPSASPKRTS